MHTIQTERGSQEGRLKSSLYLWNGCAMFLGKQTDSSIHQHHAVQIVIGIDRPFHLHLIDEAYQCRVAIVAADYPHRIVSNAGWHAVIMFDPEIEATKQLVAKRLQFSHFSILDISLVESVLPELRDYIGKIHSGDSAKRLCEGITGKLSGMENTIGIVDSRIQKALDLLHRLSVKKISVDDIARASGLSESRLVHLFKEQVGIPIRRYLLWLRLWVAIEKVTHCGSLTCAAHSADFADSAHLSRTFRRMFGITMSQVFKKRQKVQIIPYFCPNN